MNQRRKQFDAALVLAFALVPGTVLTSQAASANPGKNFAQQLVEEAVAKHTELSGVEISSPPAHQQCVTVASTEKKDFGEKCDADEFIALKTNKPFVEKEQEGGKEVYDITMPLHDATEKLIGTVGMDFKPEPDQTEPKLVELARKVTTEMEAQLPSKAKLFEPAK